MAWFFAHHIIFFLRGNLTSLVHHKSTFIMSKAIVVKSSDGETFEIDEAVASQSQIIKYMIEDGCADGVIPLPNVTAKVLLSKVIEYCKKHVDDNSETKKDNHHDAEAADLKTFDTEFMLSLKDDVHVLHKAAIYLEIQGLMDLCLDYTFNLEIVKNQFRDMTPEEEAKIRRENPWAF
uniref:SKP1-like protein 4 n=1 Tax=Erigeron canadensis TaxID=72917 RepID=UPI001CB9190C|nr:SKP1-like protein 4 [Erigeron canadensis]